ncbi:MAG TPA: type II toxin-antitoxin system VapC family toxin [Polyangiaceae bacterium]|nr:type II toxin-antitoxin system VapC family toxin [Polyangiaceae bacterium]
MSRLLLDTNAYSELKRGHPAVAAWVRKSEQLFFSSIVVGELLFGFRCGNRYSINRDELQAFLDRDVVTLLRVGPETADRFGRIAASLRARGTPLPTNDIWIAAHAMETGAELLSLDAHFEKIEGLAWHRPS